MFDILMAIAYAICSYLGMFALLNIHYFTNWSRFIIGLLWLLSPISFVVAMMFIITYDIGAMITSRSTFHNKYDR